MSTEAEGAADEAASLVQRALEREQLALCAYSDAASDARPGYSLQHAIAEVLHLTSEEDLTAVSNFVTSSPFGWSALDSWHEFIACVNAFSSLRSTICQPNMMVLRAAVKYALSDSPTSHARSYQRARA